LRHPAPKLEPESTVGERMAELGIQVDRLADARLELSERRLTARRLAREVVLVVENALLLALAGDVLRGMPNINPPDDGNNEAFHAVHVRGKYPDAPLAESWSLVVTRQGQLVLARTTIGDRGPAYPGDGPGERRFYKKVALDHDGVTDVLLAEDLESFVDRVRTALDNHLVRVERTLAGYARVEALARKLGDVMGVTFQK